jgi:hypothetical protein
MRRNQEGCLSRYPSRTEEPSVRFKQFLEARISSYEHEPQDGDQLLDTLRSHCMDALRSAQAGDFIYRGTRSELKSGVYSPGTGERKSQNTSNFYTALLDTNPKNAAFPKRSKSFICSTRRTKAKQYADNGTLVTCFPFNGTKIGYADDDDFWGLQLNFDEDFLTTIHIVDFNHFWDEICEDLGKSPEHIKSLDDAMNMLRDAPLTVVIKNLQRNHLLHGFDKVSGPSHLEIVNKFIDSLPDAYSYKRLGCKLITPDEFPSSVGSEVWFSGKCVVVTEDDMDTVREEFGL